MEHSIFIREFGETIRLSGREGESSLYTAAGHTYIAGRISFVIHVNGQDFRSDSVDVQRDKISLAKEGDVYYVQQTDGYFSFPFAQPVSFKNNDSSSILYIQEAGLGKTGQSAEVHFERLSVSIIGPVNNPQTRSQFYFSSSHTPQTLVRQRSPISGKLSFYLKKSTDGLYVEMGSPTTHVLLNDFGTVSLTLARNTLLRFYLGNFQLEFVSTPQSAHLLTFTAASGWELDEPMADIYSYVKIERLVCEDGWIRSAGINKGATATLSQKHPTEGHRQLRTKIVTDPGRLNLYYPLEVQGPVQGLTHNGKTFIDSPHIVYQSKPDETPDLRNRHYGLRVRGLSNDKGASVKLDADLAVIRFDVNTRKLFLQAGDTVTVKGVPGIASVVLPKPNPQAALRREVKIPCLPANLLVKGNSGSSAFSIDTREGILSVSDPQLETPPFAPGNKTTGNDFNTLNWTYPQRGTVTFTLTDDGPVPGHREWLNDFRIDPDTNSFTLLDRQNSTLIYDAPAADRKSGRRETGVTVITQENGKLVYAAYAAGLVFTTAYATGGLICETADPTEIYTCIRQKGKEFINVRFENVEGNPRWLVNKNVNELLIVYYDDEPNLKKFIDDNITLPEPTAVKPTSVAFWPVVDFIGIPLLKKRLGEDTKYCYDILRENYPGHRIIPGIGIDQNQSGNIDFNTHFGFGEGGAPSFRDFATGPVSKLLFPHYNDVVLGHNPSTVNGKTDPTDPKFAGVIFRNMPLMMKIPSDKMPDLLKKLVDIINKNLFLELGWKNDKGFSGIAKIPQALTGDPAFKGFDLLNNGLIKLNLNGLKCLCDQDRLLFFSCDLFLGLFEDTDAASGYRVDMAGEGKITFNEKGIDNFRFTPKPQYRKPVNVKDIIPGFDYIRVGKVDINFRQFFVEVELFPNKNLVEALPIFEAYARQTGDPADMPLHVLKTQAIFDAETGSAAISIVLDASVKLFGKWPLSIRAISIVLGKTTPNRVEIAGDFNLGLENFVKIGGRVIIQHTQDEGWDYDIHLDKIGGALALSDSLKLEGEVGWGQMFPENTAPAREALKRDELLSKGKDRDFYGVLQLKAPGIFGNSNELFVKIASKNGMPYWVCGLRTGHQINLGFGTLVEPELIFAKNSDYNGKINTIVTDAQNGIKALRKDDAGTRAEWLQKWQYSDKTNFTMVASGYLMYNLLPGAVTAKPGQDKFTALLYSSSGIIRIEGYIKMLAGLENIQVVFAIDLVKKRIFVSFQLPTFYFPSEDAASKFTFRPGQVMLGTSFGGPYYFLAGFGWPPQIGDSYERDWSKATLVTYPLPWPLPNMFAGGFKFEIDAANRFVMYAVALKVGWKYDVGFLIGKAGLEVGLGGVLVLKYFWGSRTFESLRVPAAVPSIKLHAPVDLAKHTVLFGMDTRAISAIHSHYAAIRGDMVTASGSVLAIMGEVFADIKGYAKVEIFGVTLVGVYVHAYARMRVCGDTRNGITHIGGAFGAEFCVKIGCVTYCLSAEIQVNLIGTPEDCLAASRNFHFLPQN